jgi:hypothetical protein
MIGGHLAENLGHFPVRVCEELAVLDRSDAPRSLTGPGCWILAVRLDHFMILGLCLKLVGLLVEVPRKLQRFLGCSCRCD